MRMIGAADEFWRVRLTRVDTTSELDFEWHDDILYRAPRISEADEFEQWRVEAVRVDDADQVVAIETFDDESAAREFVRQIGEALKDMTKSSFEESYLTRPAPASADDDA